MQSRGGGDSARSDRSAKSNNSRVSPTPVLGFKSNIATSSATQEKDMTAQEKYTARGTIIHNLKTITGHIHVERKTPNWY